MSWRFSTIFLLSTYSSEYSVFWSSVMICTLDSSLPKVFTISKLSISTSNAKFLWWVPRVLSNMRNSNCFFRLKAMLLWELCSSSAKNLFTFSHSSLISLSSIAATNYSSITVFPLASRLKIWAREVWNFLNYSFLSCFFFSCSS